MGATATIFSFVQDNDVGARIVQATKKPEKVNLTLRLERPLYQRVKTLIKRTDANNMQDVIRQGLVLYDALISEAENGKDIVVIDPTGESKQYSLFESQ